jgi:hypothetical protein
MNSRRRIGHSSEPLYGQKAALTRTLEVTTGKSAYKLVIQGHLACAGEQRCGKIEVIDQKTQFAAAREAGCGPLPTSACTAVCLQLTKADVAVTE